MAKLVAIFHSLLGSVEVTDKAANKQRPEAPIIVAKSGRFQTRSYKPTDAAGVIKVFTNCLETTSQVDTSKFEKTLRHFYDEERTNFIAETCSNLWRPVAGLDRIVGWAYSVKHHNRGVPTNFSRVMLFLPSLKTIDAQLYQEIHDALLGRIYERVKQDGGGSVSIELLFDEHWPTAVTEKQFLTAQGFEVAGRYRRVAKREGGSHLVMLLMQKHLETEASASDATAPPEYSKEAETTAQGRVLRDLKC